MLGRDTRRRITHYNRLPKKMSDSPPYRTFSVNNVKEIISHECSIF